jgi:hypothetical protein
MVQVLKDGNTNTVRAPRGVVTYTVTVTNPGFVDRTLGAIGYLVWNDQNGNCIRESSESVNRDGVFEAPIILPITNANGHYIFARLPAGSYEVTVTDNFGVLQDRTLTCGTNPLRVYLAAGQLFPTANFGYFRQGEIPPIDPPPGGTTPAPIDIPTTPAGLLAMLAALLLLGTLRLQASRVRVRS